MPLDIRNLKAAGRLSPGQSYGWQWTADGERVANIGVATFLDAMALRYVWTPRGDDPRAASCRIPLVTTPCHLGGARAWFLCPRCRTRRAVLYFGGATFACRTCLRLGYLSESMTVLDRLWRKQSKLEARLGPEGEKPKRMRWRTYERLLDKIDEVEVAKDAAWRPGFARLAERLGFDPAELVPED
jgi:hypothetical protein